MVGAHGAESEALTTRNGEMNAAMHGTRRLAKSREADIVAILAEHAASIQPAGLSDITIMLQVDEVLTPETPVYRVCRSSLSFAFVETGSAVLTNINRWDDQWKAILAKVPAVNERGRRDAALVFVPSGHLRPGLDATSRIGRDVTDLLADQGRRAAKDRGQEVRANRQRRTLIYRHDVPLQGHPGAAGR
jgi:hypothetical protein